jgi:hypothetical protein
MTSRVGWEVPRLIAANLGYVDADALGELLLSHGLLLAQSGQVFREVHGPLMVNRHGRGVSQYARRPRNPLTWISHIYAPGGIVPRWRGSVRVWSADRGSRRA